MGLNTFSRFAAIFNKGDNFCDILVAFLHNKCLLEGVYFKREQILSF